MAEDRKTVRVFVGSPGDLVDERQVVPQILAELNRVKAWRLGYNLEASGWEDTLPGRGRPQARINAELIACDVAVMMLWRRWGSPTGTHSSGFLEEFELCQAKQLPVLLYFKRIPPEDLEDPGPQLKGVLSFRNEVENARALLYSSFDDVDHFRIQLRYDIARWLDEYDAKISSEDMLIKPGSWLRHVAKNPAHSKHVVETLISSFEERGRIATLLSEEAYSRFISGATQRAEFLYVTAISFQPTLEALQGYQHLLFQTGRKEGMKKITAIIDQIAEKEDPRARIFAAEAKGNLALQEGRLNEARDHFLVTSKLADEYEIHDTSCNALMHLGEIERIQGNYSTAAGYLDRAIAAGKMSDDPSLYVAASNHRINLLLQERRFVEAAPMIEDAFVFANENGIAHAKAITRMYRGMISFHQGNKGEAIVRFNDALKVARAAGDRGLEITIISNLGNLHMKSEAFAEARQAFRDALVLARAHENVEQIADTSYSLATAEIYNRGIKSEAIALAETAVRIYASLGSAGKLASAEALLSVLRRA